MSYVEPLSNSYGTVVVSEHKIIGINHCNMIRKQQLSSIFEEEVILKRMEEHHHETVTTQEGTNAKVS